MIFGNFADIHIGTWSSIDLVVDRSTLASSGGLVLRAFYDCDLALGHGESFVKLIDYVAP